MHYILDRMLRSNFKMLKLILLWFLIIRFSYGKVIFPTINVHPHPLSNEVINHINSIQNLWTAGRNFGRNTSLTYLKRLMGVKQTISANPNNQKVSKRSLYVNSPNKYPENFDAREHWPNCPTIGEIRDQGACGSCWALAAVEAMSDRVCIHSNGTVNFHFSAQHLMSCCPFCGNGGNGCNGGDPMHAWYYWTQGGIVSGGSYGSRTGCLPYKIPPCDHKIIIGSRPMCEMNYIYPKCIDKCEKGYKIPFLKDLHYGKSITKIENDVEQIKQEIFDNGPVEAEFLVHEDFLHYKSGIYKKVHGSAVGRHAIRILGWGIENGESYWLAANSWNSDWGQNGFFKIRRGSNECGIENTIIAGLPKLVN